jgi:hypothetical protein
MAPSTPFHRIGLPLSRPAMMAALQTRDGHKEFQTYFIPAPSTASSRGRTSPLQIDVLIRERTALRIPYLPRFSWRAATIIIVSFTITIWNALARGQDVNWDQKHYHIAVPFLLEHGEFWNSVVPAGRQGFFNPYLLQIQYFGIQHLSPLLFDTILALVQSTAFMIAGFTCVEIVRSSSPSIDPRETTRLGLLGFALCLSAPVALSEAGTTFIDLITAVPVVGAYALLLQRDRLGPLVAAPLAGILLGAATALKLTNGVFALGAIGFAFAGPDRPSQQLRWLTLCGASALLGFLAVGGSWHLSLWEHFRNPLFPYYNNIFHSPDFGTTVSDDDDRFLPHSVLDIWRYPLYWLFGGGTANGLGSPSCELYFWDARWAVVTIGGVGFLLGLARFPAWRKQCLANPATGLFFAVVLAYLVWLAKFGYQRYMAPIDILCGAATLILALQVSRARLRLAALTALAAVSVFSVLRVPDWGHLPWRSHWQTINPERLDFGGPSLVFVSGVLPTLYIAASLPLDAHYVGLVSDFDLRAQIDNTFTRQIRQYLASSGIRLKLASKGVVPDRASDVLACYGLAVTADCQTLSIAGETFRICDVKRTL